MSTIFVFFLTLLQLGILAYSYFKPDTALFVFLVIDSSPLHLVRSMIDENISAMNHFLPLIILYHAVKYIFLCRSQFTEYRYGQHYSAVAMEIAYLVICAQYA